MEKTIATNIHNVFKNIDKIRYDIHSISSQINLSNELFYEINKLLIQLEDGNRIIEKKYIDNENTIAKIEVSGYNDCSKVESYMWSPEWKKVL